MKKYMALLIIPFMAILSSSTASAQQPGPVKNIVIVHGAFADGSGFEAVYNILTRKGYHVTIVQNPLTSLEEDVAATNFVLSRQDGPVILVGHSWGGTVITQAGVSDKVVRLVYLEGFMPEEGETTAQLAGSEPALAENGVMMPDENGLIWYSKEKFHAGFTGDLSREKSDFMYDSQGAIAAKCFTTPVTAAAWKTKPSYGVVATGDKSINPVILRKMYRRAGATITEIDASHVVYISQPAKIAAVIEMAAKGQTAPAR
ncbi:MAG TPA: alpha/beta hydrolase [Puia sp.]|uniref:alpha/beta hydrolase n=1 Tax=Puia sp. TaxID=2045100 RepID=UPI002C8A2D2E|nr:alpha/beta hydrolase [Puia sp.]HVU94479.1 alpha/beta hydrolase [Puia sp.]